MARELKLSEVFPNISKEWDITKNLDSPDIIPAFSNEKKWWICRFGHSWEATVANRSSGRGCNTCRKSKDPEILKYRLKEKHGIDKNWLLENYINSSLSFDELWKTFGIGHTVIRKSLKLYDLTKDKTQIVESKNKKRDQTNLSRYGSSNPHSFSGNKSKEEDAIAEILRKLEIDFQQSCSTVISPKELDLYLPELSVAIEYNGNYWHNKSEWNADLQNGTTNSREALKTLLCEERGIRLIHIWEDDWLAIEDKPAHVKKLIEGVTCSN